MERYPCTLVWIGLAPLRVEACCRLAVAGKVSLVDNLRRKGIGSNCISDVCSLCEKDGETDNRLFLHCETLPFFGAASLIDVFYLGVCRPASLGKVVETWGMIPFIGCGLLICKVIPFAILWDHTT